ncbi:MAG: hypothetical protein PVF43_09270, partial [Candidatus Eiseniibacteriota bacterium]
MLSSRRLLVILILVAVSSGRPTAGVSASPTQDHCYRGTAGSSESFTVTGEAGWSARTVEATLRPLGGPSGALGLVLHHQDDSNLYLFLYGTGTTALRIYRKFEGSYTLLASTPDTIPPGEAHVMRAVDAGEGRLELHLDGVLRAETVDTTFDAGRVGLRVYDVSADFDDVLALDAAGDTLIADDFDDGDAAGWVAGP